MPCIKHGQTSVFCKYCDEEIALLARLADLLGDEYQSLCVVNGEVCGIRDFVVTRAVVVGIDETGYERRYCYEQAAEAQAALDDWKCAAGLDHPPGNWIKLKGRFNGEPVDMFNPNFK